MPKKLTPQESRDVLQDIHDGEEFRDAYLQEGMRVIQYREGRRWSPNRLLEEGKMAEMDLVPDNIMASHHNALVPQLVFAAPRYCVRPVASQHEQEAKELEAKLAWVLHTGGWNLQREYAIGNSADFGWADVQIGFSMPYGQFPGQEKEARSSGPLYRRALEDMGVQTSADTNGRKFIRPLEEVDRKKPLLWREQYVRPHEVWLRSVMNEDMVVDPKATDLCDAAWVAVAIWMMQDEMMELGKIGLFHGDLDEIQPFNFNDQVGDAASEILDLRGYQFYQERARAAKRLQLVKLWQIWDRRTMEFCVVPDQCDKIGSIRETEWPAPRKSFPFHRLSLVPGRQGRLYPQSLLSLIEPQQAEANKLTSLGLEAAEKSKKIYAVDEGGGMEDKYITAWSRSRNGDMVPVPGLADKLGQPVDLTLDAEMYYKIRQTVKSDANNVLGQAAEEQARPSQVKGMTQVAIMHQQSQIKQSFRADVKIRGWDQGIGEDALIWLRESAYAQPGVAAAEAAAIFEPRIFFRNQEGLSNDGKKTILLRGLSRAALETQYQVTVEPVPRTRFDKEQQAMKIQMFANLWGPMGVANMWKAGRKFAELNDIDVEGILNEPPEVISATKEHLMMLQGMPVAIQPEEDHQKHLKEHNATLQKIQQTFQTGQPPDLEAQLFFERQDAVQLLVQHIQEYAKVMAPQTGRSMEETALAPNQARMGDQAIATQQQQSSGAPIPQGQVGQPLGQIMAGGG